MVGNKISLRYATSLLDIAEEKNMLSILSDDMELFHSALEISRQLQNMIQNPVIKPSTKKTIIEEIFKDKINAESLRFLKFVIDKNRENFLDEIVQNFLLLRDEKLGIVNVSVKTPYPLNKEQSDALRTKFENLLSKKARMNFSIDTTLIGGFWAKVDDTVYDATFQHQLGLLKKQFLEGSLNLN